jgi:hypothetical protein
VKKRQGPRVSGIVFQEKGKNIVIPGLIRSRVSLKYPKNLCGHPGEQPMKAFWKKLLESQIARASS